MHVATSKVNAGKDGLKPSPNQKEPRNFEATKQLCGYYANIT
jgi:hypothetical protein